VNNALFLKVVLSYCDISKLPAVVANSIVAVLDTCIAHSWLVTRGYCSTRNMQV